MFLPKLTFSKFKMGARARAQKLALGPGPGPARANFGARARAPILDFEKVHFLQRKCLIWYDKV